MSFGTYGGCAGLEEVHVVLQIILVCKTIIQRPKRYPVNYFTV